MPTTWERLMWRNVGHAVTKINTSFFSNVPPTFFFPRMRLESTWSPFPPMKKVHGTKMSKTFLAYFLHDCANFFKGDYNFRLTGNLNTRNYMWTKYLKLCYKTKAKGNSHATITLWLQLGGLLSTQETRVALGDRLDQLSRFFLGYLHPPPPLPSPRASITRLLHTDP